MIARLGVLLHLTKQRLVTAVVGVVLVTSLTACHGYFQDTGSSKWFYNANECLDHSNRILLHPVGSRMGGTTGHFYIDGHGDCLPQDLPPGRISEFNSLVRDGSGMCYPGSGATNNTSIWYVNYEEQIPYVCGSGTYRNWSTHEVITNAGTFERNGFVGKPDYA